MTIKLTQKQKDDIKKNTELASKVLLYIMKNPGASNKKIADALSKDIDKLSSEDVSNIRESLYMEVAVEQGVIAFIKGLGELGATKPDSALEFFKAITNPTTIVVAPSFEINHKNRTMTVEIKPDDWIIKNIDGTDTPVHIPTLKSIIK